MAREPSPAVTIATIALEAGVSSPTVSKVLNGRTDVAAGTRKRVEDVLRRNNYQRRHKPETRRSRLLDVVFADLDSPWALEVIRGVERVAHAEGMGVVVSQSSHSTTPDDAWMTGVLSRRPTGVILALSALTPVQREQLRSRDIPFVAFDPTDEVPDDVPCVGSANQSGGEAATRHLIELGHRRIGVIGGLESTLSTRARVDGYLAAMSRAGLPVDPELVGHGDSGVAAGHDVGRRMLTLPVPPTAVFATTDLSAVGLYEAARQLGLRIPDDVSVVGYDDLPVARWVGPELTTVHQPVVRMAETATRLVMELSRGGVPVTTRLDLATELIVRGSTAPPRSQRS